MDHRLLDGRGSYSIACSCSRSWAHADRNQIIATDVDPNSIDLLVAARAAPHRPGDFARQLERFFIREDLDIEWTNTSASGFCSRHDRCSTHFRTSTWSSAGIYSTRSSRRRGAGLSRLRDRLKPGGVSFSAPPSDRFLFVLSFSRLGSGSRSAPPTAANQRGEHMGRASTSGRRARSKPSTRSSEQARRPRCRQCGPEDSPPGRPGGDPSRSGLRIGATRATGDLFRIVETDRGRRIDELPRRFAQGTSPASFSGDRTQGGVEDDVLGDDGRWYAMRTLAHRTAAGTIAGSVSRRRHHARKSAEELLVRSANSSRAFRMSSAEPRLAARRARRRLAGGGARPRPLCCAGREGDDARRSSDAGGRIPTVRQRRKRSRLLPHRGDHRRDPDGSGKRRATHPQSARGGPAGALHRPIEAQDRAQELIGNAVDHGGGDVEANVRPSEGGLEFDRIGVGHLLAEQRQVFGHSARATAARMARVGSGWVS